MAGMAGVNAGSRLRAPSEEPELDRRLAASAEYRPRPAGDIVDWLAERRRRVPVQVTRIPFERMAGWSFAPDSGDLVHESGRFFTVGGIHARTDYGATPEWRQPIIYQQDVAIVGILAKEIDGVLHFLMQAKIEPGNVNTVQLSPTVQSTSSNYLRTHRGARSRFVEYFTEPGRARVLVDVLQSEQGAWFWAKRNRNVVMEVTDEVEPHDDFAWMTLGQILDLLHHPNVVNMDSRTVLACLLSSAPYMGALPGDGAPAASGSALLSPVQVRSWLTERKSAYTLTTRAVPLDSVDGWERDAEAIRRPDGRYFSVVGVEVHAGNREVSDWCQPLLAPSGTGLAALVVRRINGVRHLLVRADLRPGCRDTVELGPTVQCTPENYEDATGERRPRYLDLVLSRAVRVQYDVVQSEEGGRFRQALTRHLVVEVGGGFPAQPPPDFCWLTVPQVMELARQSYQVNIEARSLLLCLHAL
ncbi:MULTISPECIES: NDP-hexose 2,3-dehydratase family protein [Actinomadura]|uniref:Oxidase EvaA n=1 Tax=Actinomadura citrea TaxID=46158 RepID=A0A7Y9GC13_9ACTN|nr:NDP-hexose 2,3-dehydratase family protein [Actinomadura citrea]NYE13698.1 oxidase EvaA [Actinomadura citrea]GGU10189.1 NDP-hexose 2,3-dehydratase [Actinomadura citrea]